MITSHKDKLHLEAPLSGPLWSLEWQSLVSLVYHCSMVRLARQYGLRWSLVALNGLRQWSQWSLVALVARVDKVFDFSVPPW